MALSQGQIARLWINQGGDPKYANVMSRIALRESGGRPHINNRGTNSNGTVDWGLFQVNDIWRRDPVVGKLFKSGAILTPQGATQAAIHILKVQGPKAWATYNPSVDSKYIGQMPGRPKQAVRHPGASATPSVSAPAAAPDQSAQRSALISQYLSTEHQPGALTGLASGLIGLQHEAQTATQPVPVAHATGQSGTAPEVAAPGSAPDAVRTLIERANAIDSHHYNYEWGGGHNAGNAPSHGLGHGSGAGIGFDCSGAVSKVLGINPRVAAQFESWGQAGRGKHVTIYANASHTFMEINGKFFGTSGQNPGGGARWYRWHPDAAYLRGFVARHPKGM